MKQCNDCGAFYDEDKLDHLCIKTPYPHNMTRGQWRHELAGRFAQGTPVNGDLTLDEKISEWSYRRADAILIQGEKNG